MNNADFLKLIKDYNFEEAGEIHCQDDRFSFDLKTENHEHGFVYMWVEVSKQIFTVVYVGKAGKTLRARCSQHRGGFRSGSNTGLRNARLVQQGISNGKRYLIYARKSKPLPFLLCGEDNIPSECVEELAFIQNLGQHGGIRPNNSFKRTCLQYAA